MKTTKSDPQGRKPFPWSVAAGSRARLSAHLGVFSSQRQADVLCTVNLCGTCSADFMRGSDVAFKNKAMQYLCLAPLVLAIFRVSPHASVFFHVLTFYDQKKKKKRLCCQASRECCCVLMGILRTATFFAESSSHPHSFGVVSDSLRLLAVSSGDDLKRPYGIASWCGAAIGALGGNQRRDLTSLRRQNLARGSALQSQHHSGCCPCAFSRARSAYRSRQVLRNLIRFFRCRNIGALRSRS